MRQVRGTFSFIMAPGRERPCRRPTRRLGFGRIDLRAGTAAYWNTVQIPLNEFAIECGAYTAPTGNGATGTFWITRERRNGRYRLMLWEPAIRPRCGGARPLSRGA